MEEILEFLDKAEQAGKTIPSIIGPQVDLGDGNQQDGHRTVAFEARQIKNIFLKMHA